jgi:hypothetical protein
MERFNMYRAHRDFLLSSVSLVAIAQVGPKPRFKMVRTRKGYGFKIGGA